MHYKDDVRIAMLDDVLESDSPKYAEKPMTKTQIEEIARNMAYETRVEELDFPQVMIEPGKHNRPEVKSPFKADSPSLRWMSTNVGMQTIANQEERIRNM